MYQTERIEKITDILKKNGYVTVKYLTETLRYSTATINRDLNLMQKQNLIRRTYGGAELVVRKSVPLSFRYHKMKSEKNHLGKVAADLVNDGDTIFLDGSTTTDYLGIHLTEKKNLTVITNNIRLVAFLSKHGINVICLGGTVKEPPYILGGNPTAENVKKYNADKMFFSSGAVSKNGLITTGIYSPIHLAMAEHSKKVYVVVDNDKINDNFKENLFDLNSVDGIITDYKFSDEIKQKYKNTEFIEV